MTSTGKKASMFLILTLFVMALLMLFSKKSFPVDLIGGAFEYVTYDNVGNPLRRQSIKVGEKNYDVIKSFFIKEESDWNYDFASYLPNRRLESSNMIINCVPGGIVTNFKHPLFGWMQIAKHSDVMVCPTIEE